MYKEIYTFTNEEIKDFIDKHFKRTGEKWTKAQALEAWVHVNYDVRHTNGLMYRIGRNRVTVIQYDC